MPIQVQSLSKSYNRPGNTPNKVLDNLWFDWESNDFVSLIGSNGCGKTTLLNLLAGLTTPDSGKILYDLPLSGPPRVGYVWQNYRASLLPWLSAVENIAFPLRLVGATASYRLEVATELMSEFMPSVDPRSKCYDLSGGQQQLLCLLRSAVAEPHLLLLDEPFSALDQKANWTMSSYVEKIWLEHQIPTMFVSHDIDTAILLADKICLMDKGIIARCISNSLPRPRNVRMLTSEQHIELRRAAIDFLLEKE